MSSSLITQALERQRGELPQGVTRTVVVPCRLGLHLRVAAVVVTMARRFQSDIYFVTGRHRVDAKSMLGMLGLGVVRGKSLALTARGQDADRAIRVLSDLFETPDVLCRDGTTATEARDAYSSSLRAAVV